MVASSGIAFAARGIGLAALAFALVATGLYGISGELSDNTANIISQPVQDTTPTSKFINYHFSR
ncbi:TPA: hypothetical protein JBE10_15885 [Legionella pneumophila subsp. pneumophila]|uniref:hypothetical protein n=1 Tax=Legionella pneumophila TaxID=446 RepID=UPI000777384E|nr:hypothetical protein [Legionella pneumophila]HAT9058454.1 hypothetical protein [Legionella pneumophila subsp. pneumophila]HAT9073371.1 hypothetical protein [Legionella pneumophila subsp. pneumophila]HAT9114241.1 hypothetical protein [Legionella pneumophila subsp. pneumophila]HAT9154038.1 hypothetical protein [Legionella pneumophila subsp. pneumophila]HAT9156925.1 hypothetical protein [Legionella pneumophila subsp. pneumophila]